MGILDKLFGGGKKKQQQQQQAAVAVEAPPCPHAVLVPRWDSVDDMGKEDKATRYMCEACHQMFSPAEARELREGIAQRMQESLEELVAQSETPAEETASGTPETEKRD
jgi:hypothetical protein